MIDVIRIALCNIKKWAVTPRIYIVPILLIIFINMSVNPVLNVSFKLGEAVSPWIFPFILNDEYMVSMIFFTLILLLCDAPFISEEHTFMVIRSGKTKFYTAQILYIMLACAIFVVTAVTATILLLLPNLTYTDDWGKILGTLAQTTLNSQTEVPLNINYSIMINYSPIEAMLICSFMMWIIAVFIGVIMCLLNSLINRFLGTIIAIILVLMQFGISFFYGSSGYWFTPTSWVKLSIINITGEGTSPPLLYCITILLAGIIIMSAITIIVNRKRELKIYSKI